jgi:hypothetical protein
MEESIQLDIAHKKVVKKPWSTDNFVVLYDEKDDVFWTGNAKGLLIRKVRLKPN